jgi:hypothetical protein
VFTRIDRMPASWVRSTIQCLKPGDVPGRGSIRGFSSAPEFPLPDRK